MIFNYYFPHRLIQFCHLYLFFLFFFYSSHTLRLIFIYADEINKEFTSLIENDTLTVCNENQHDKRVFVLASDSPVLSSTISTTTTTTQSSQNHHNGKVPIIYFVTPTYPR